MLRVSANLARRGGVLRKYNNLQLAPLTDESDSKSAWVALSLLNDDFSEIFTVLAQDLIDRVEVLSSEQLRLNEFIGRITVWHQLFDAANKDGLSIEARRGLFGELYTMQTLIESGTLADFVSESWTGLQGGSQDFRFAGIALEVKTSKGNGEAIRITNEHQLDLNQVDKLFLAFVLVSETSTSGISLPDIIDLIRNVLPLDANGLEHFNTTLIRSGYLEIHRHLYEEIRYSIRKNMLFHVSDSFPRLEAASLPEGVSEVTYKIRFLLLTPYLTSFSELSNLLVP